MKALILVGGKGTRLKPYTNVIPKPLLPVGDRPILEIILHQLKSSGVKEIVLAVGHLSHLFESFFGDGKDHDLKISYSFEDKPLGTAGAIANVLDELSEDFIVMNGDLLTTLNYKKLFDYHIKNKSNGTIATFKREITIPFGVLDVDQNNKMISLVEKPTYPHNVGMGVNVLNKNIVKPILENNTYIDMPDLMLKIQKKHSNVFCYFEDCFWLDMGQPDEYEEANKIYEENKKLFLY